MPKQEEVSLFLKLKDGVTKTLGKVKASFTKNMDAMKQASLVFAGAFAGVAVGVFKAVDAFKTQQRVTDQTNRVLASTAQAAGLTADEIANMARELQKSTGVSDEVTQSAQNILLTFTNIKKDVFPDVTKTVLDMTAAMNHGVITQENLKMQAIQLGKAINDPTKGLTALTRVGVSFTDQQKEQIKAMQAAGDTAGAQALMLAELQTEFAGSAENLNTLEGAQRASAAAVGDMMEIIGKAFLPVMTEVAKITKDIAEKMQEWLPNIKDLILPVTILAGAITGLMAIGGAFVTLGPMIGAAFTAMTGPIGIAITAVAAITSAFVYFKNSNSELAIRVRATWETLGQIISKYAQFIKESLKFNFKEAGSTYKELLNLIKNSRNVFAENVAAEKAAIDEGIENKKDEVIQRQEIQAEAKEAELAIDQEFLDSKAEMDLIAEEARKEFEQQKKDFDALTAQERYQLLVDTLGKEAIAKNAARVAELVAKGKHEAAKEAQNKIYHDAFREINKDTIKKMEDGYKKHWSFILAGQKLNADQRSKIDDAMAQAYKDILLLMGKESVAAFRFMQAVSIGQTLMKTYEAAQGAFNSLVGIPGIGLGLAIAGAATATAAGLVRAESIRRERPPAMAVGGSVVKGGLAELHPAEVVLNEGQAKEYKNGGPMIINLKFNEETMQTWIITQDEVAERMERGGLR